MIKYFLYAILIALFYLLLSNIQGISVSFVALIITTVGIAIALFIGFNKELNFIVKLGYAFIIGVGITLLVFIIFKIDKNLFNYYFDILHMRITLKS